MSYRDTKNLLDYAANIDRSKRKLLANTIRDILATEQPDVVIKPHMVGKTPTENASFESAASAAARSGGTASPVVARAIDTALGQELGLRPGQYSQMVSSGLQNLRNLRDQTVERDRVSGLLTAIREPQSPPNVQLTEAAGIRTGYPNYAEIDNRSVPIESAITRYTAPVEPSFTDTKTGTIVPIRQVQVTDVTETDPWRGSTETVSVNPVRNTNLFPEIRALPPARSGSLPIMDAVVKEVVTPAIEKPASLSDAIFQREIANKAGYTDTSARRLFAPTEIDNAYMQGRADARMAGRAPANMAEDFVRYGNLSKAEFIPKIVALAAMENDDNTQLVNLSKNIYNPSISKESSPISVTAVPKEQSPFSSSLPAIYNPSIPPEKRPLLELRESYRIPTKEMLSSSERLAASGRPLIRGNLGIGAALAGGLGLAALMGAMAKRSDEV